MKELFFLGVIFSLPAIFIIIRNYLWDLSFWQKKDYSLEKFTLNILWDLDKDKFSTNLISSKFIFFSLLILGYTFPLSGVLGISLLFITWSIEAFNRLTSIFLTREPNIQLNKPRNLISFLSFILVLTLLFLVVTLPFLSSVTTSYTPSNLNTINLSTVSNIPSVYIYLLLLSSLLLILDLATSTIVIIQQLKINFLVMIRRKIKLLIFSSQLNKLKASNKIILMLTDDFHEFSILAKFSKSDFITLETDNIDFVYEYIVDHKIINKTIFVSISLEPFKNAVRFEEIHSIIINSESIDALSLLNLVPINVNVFLNSDLYEIKSARRIFKGVISVFGQDMTTAGENSNTVWLLKHRSNNSELNLNYLINFKEYTFSLPTLNFLYGITLASLFCIAKSLDINEKDLIKNLLDNFKESSKNYFALGDNNTRIMSFYNNELSYQDLLRQISIAKKYKGNNKLILLTNGIGKRKLAAKMYKELINQVDIVISNDYKLVKRLKKIMLQAYYADNFKDFTYFARKFSKEGDILLIEGHYREPFARILSKLS